MWPFRQCLGVDHIDRYNTWAVLFLLLLTLISWLLPLSPVILSQAQTRPTSMAAGRKPVEPSSEQIESRVTRRYKAQCWCPAQFTGAHVDYTNAVCGSAFNFILNGGNYTEAPASLFPPRRPGGPVPTMFGENMAEIEQVETEVMEETDTDKRKQENQQREEEEERRRERVNKALYIFQVSTPFNVFLLAVCLAIPRLVWHALSCLMGGVNVDQTLVSANQGSSLDHVSRQQLHSELIKAATDVARASPGRTSCLYLLLKLLMCVAVVSETVVVHKTFLPETRDLAGDLQHREMSLASSAMDNKDSSDNTRTSSTQNTTKDHERLLFCGFSIRILQQVQNYQMQCVFSPVPAPTPPQPSLTPPPVSLSQGPTPNPPNISSSSVSQVYVYECLYLILFTLLLALATSNLISLLVWLLKLTCRPCHVGSDLVLDIYFLLQMARENAGLDFVMAFSQRETAGKLETQGLAEEDIELKA